jgi:hypothetical protein
MDIDGALEHDGAVQLWSYLVVNLSIFASSQRI